jgi:hypothetical protein
LLEKMTEPCGHLSLFLGSKALDGSWRKISHWLGSELKAPEIVPWEKQSDDKRLGHRGALKQRHPCWYKIRQDLVLIALLARASSVGEVIEWGGGCRPVLGHEYVGSHFRDRL